MTRELNILMIGHHRKYRNTTRAQAIAKHLVLRGHKITLLVTANERRFGIVESEWDGIRVIEAPDLLWGRLRTGWDPWNLAWRIAYLRKDTSPYDPVHCFETRSTTISRHRATAIATGKSFSPIGLTGLAGGFDHCESA
jgi:hypothetical protein